MMNFSDKLRSLANVQQTLKLFSLFPGIMIALIRILKIFLLKKIFVDFSMFLELAHSTLKNQQELKTFDEKCF